MNRVRDAIELAALLAANVPPEWRDKPFSSTTWLNDPRNIALRIDGDLAMFEHIGPGTYLGHIWFASRGKTALANARAMLAAMFDDYGAALIRGETPRRNVALFVRKLGFTFTGEAIRPIGLVQTCELRNGEQWHRLRDAISP